jgi:hypothetical protein
VADGEGGIVSLRAERHVNELRIYARKGGYPWMGDAADLIDEHERALDALIMNTVRGAHPISHRSRNARSSPACSAVTTGCAAL